MSVYYWITTSCWKTVAQKRSLSTIKISLLPFDWKMWRKNRYEKLENFFWEIRSRKILRGKISVGFTRQQDFRSLVLGFFLDFCSVCAKFRIFLFLDWFWKRTSLEEVEPVSQGHQDFLHVRVGFQERQHLTFHWFHPDFSTNFKLFFYSFSNIFQTLITQFNDYGNGRFFDPRTQQAFRYDHLRKEAAEFTKGDSLPSGESIEKFEPLRQAIQQQADQYIINHYSKSGTAAVFASTDASTGQPCYHLCIESHQFQPKNFW